MPGKPPPGDAGGQPRAPRRRRSTDTSTVRLSDTSRATGPDQHGPVPVSGKMKVAPEIIKRLLARPFGRCRLLRLISVGGMGMVFEASHMNLMRKCAIKLMLPSELLKGPKEVQRFIGEAQSAALLRHPNIATVYDLGEDDGKLFIEMEYVDGSSVADLIVEHGRFSISETLRIGTEVARGLQAAHRAGVLHRDIKPGNILVSRQGEVKVVDFGLAYILHAGASGPTEMAGTPAYMSPEPVRGLPCDERSDIYSLGVTLFTMLTGDVPFSGGTAAELMYRKCNTPPPDLRALRPDAPPALALAIMKAMAIEPDQRYQSASEFMRALMQIPPSETAHPWAGPSEEDAQSSVLQFVRNYTLFAGAAGESGLLGGLVGVAEFAPPCTLMWEGERGNQAFIIVRGKAEVSVMRKGKKIVLDEVGPGAMLGELALITGQPRSATVRALEPIVAAALSEAAFMEILQRYPTVVLSLLKELSYRLYRAQQACFLQGHAAEAEGDHPAVAS